MVGNLFYSLIRPLLRSKVYDLIRFDGLLVLIHSKGTFELFCQWKRVKHAYRLRIGRALYLSFKHFAVSWTEEAGWGKSPIEEIKANHLALGSGRLLLWGGCENFDLRFEINFNTPLLQDTKSDVGTKFNPTLLVYDFVTKVNRQ